MHRIRSRSTKSADGSMTFRGPRKENMVSVNGPLDLAFSWKITKLTKRIYITRRQRKNVTLRGLRELLFKFFSSRN
jgi:hypothetical protein